MYKLIVDDREQAVIPFFKESYQDIEVEVKRIQIGDYVIMKDNKIIFAIERKSWIDLSGSIKDGRKENVNKLISLREQTGCKLLYLIEGRARFAPTKKFSRIPYKNLQVHLDHLMVRDNIFMIYSDSAEDTTSRLIEFITNYISLGAVDVTMDTNSAIDDVSMTGGESSNSSEIITDDVIIEKLDEMSILTSVIPKTDLQIMYNLWSAIPQITLKTASLFIDANIHISELFIGKISSSEISVMRYASGTIIGTRANKIIKIRDNENVDNYKHYCNILAELPMITRKTASLILMKVTFNDLLRKKLSIQEIADIRKTPRSKIGITAATNIYKFLINKN